MKLRKILAEYGCRFVRHGKGDHDIWYSPITDRNLSVDGKIDKRHTANGVLDTQTQTHRKSEKQKILEQVSTDFLQDGVCYAYSWMLKSKN